MKRTDCCPIAPLPARDHVSNCLTKLGHECIRDLANPLVNRVVGHAMIAVLSVGRSVRRTLRMVISHHESARQRAC